MVQNLFLLTLAPVCNSGTWPSLFSNVSTVFLFDEILQGSLRDLSKKNQDHSLNQIERGDGEANDSDCGTSGYINNNHVAFSNSDNPALIPEQ
ncbi:hypothetical protein CK203_033181 [Vitis vinifera]|uniref:Uncharacterized protein n=1 Tax=Vitis vinifera TaxID=29760 RepID=A0A438G095_VITVI|nr:hypothetical protein CK203_033181 [Vitis vinifera]